MMNAYGLEVTAAGSTGSTGSSRLLLVGLVLVLPLVEIDLEPVSLGLLLEEAIPVGPVLVLLQRKLDAAVTLGEL